MTYPFDNSSIIYYLVHMPFQVHLMKLYHNQYYYH
nr:MAG TPA: hypothetical protein [Bacteriophage sp.]